MTIGITCPKCGYSKTLAEDRIPPGVRWATCPRCKERFDFTLGWSGAKRPGRNPPPWERRVEIGLRQAIFQTAKQVVFSPRAFFRHTSAEGGLRDPLLFGILFGSIGLMLELFWHFLSGEESLSSVKINFLGGYGAGAVFLAAAVLCPLAATAMICVTSLLIHFMLTVVRGNRNGFEATFRVVAYSQATQGWALLPYVGGLVATLWLLIVQVVGSREIHEVSYLRVAMAFLIPLALPVAVLLAAGLSLFLMD